MPEGPIQRQAWPDPPPGSRPPLGERAWHTFRALRRRGILTRRRIGCGLLALVLLAVAAVYLLDRAADSFMGLFRDEPEPVAGSPFDTVAPSTTPGTGSEVVDRIAARDRLIVAVQQVPGLTERDPSGGGYTGLDVALLDLVARDLGVDPERTSYKPLPAGSREESLARGEVDILAGGYEITAERRGQVAFAGPYLVSAQRLAVPAGSPVTGPADLGDRQVCAVGGSAAAATLTDRIGRQLVTRSSLDACVGLLSARVAAVAADESQLTGTGLAPVGAPLGETRYGFGLPPGDELLRDRVQSVLRDAVADGTWERLYAEHLGTPVPDPPTLDP